MFNNNIFDARFLIALPPLFLQYMQAIDKTHLSVLQIIYQIVKDDAYPLKYQLHPREIILRSMQDWSMIQSALTALENEGLVVTRRLDTLLISVTEQGLDLCQAKGAK